VILCLGPTPAAQRVMVFRQLTPDTVNRAATTLEGAAGKAVNVAKVLKSLGERPVLTGFLGGVRGEILRAQLQARGMELAFVTVAAQTRQCLTVVDESTGTQTELVEESQPVAAADYEALEAFVRRRIARCRAIIVSGSLTPGGPTDFYARCVKLTHEQGVLAVVDAQGAPLAAALKARPGLVKPNRAELAATVVRILANETAVTAAMRELQTRGAERVVVTAGKQPTLAFDGQYFWRITPPKIAAKNPIGSGDAFTAGLVWRLLRGDDLGEACRWASAAGAANALTLLPGEVERTDVERLVKEVKAERL
jgi:tagatose 6-phosphate kinase